MSKTKKKYAKIENNNGKIEKILFIFFDRKVSSKTD